MGCFSLCSESSLRGEKNPKKPLSVGVYEGTLSRGQERRTGKVTKGRGKATVGLWAELPRSPVAPAHATS